MSRILKLAVFAIVAAAQLAAPAWMIGQREWVLRHGMVYKFRTAPVDPYDAFRGRYVWLRFEGNTAPWTGTGPIPYEMTPSDVIGSGPFVYATLTTGPDGFAKFSGASLTRPASGDYLYARADYYWDLTALTRTPITRAPDRLAITLPFDRYYMNEAAAPAAEQAYREHSNTKKHDAYATVRVWKGHAVLEGLYVGDQRIEDVPASRPGER